MTNNEILMTKELLMTKSFGRRAARVSGRKAGAPLAGWAAGCLPLRLGRRSRGKRRTEGADWSKFGVAGPPLSAKVRKSPPLSAFRTGSFFMGEVSRDPPLPCGLWWTGDHEER